MPVFRSQNHVPSVYVEESRDFQLFCKALDLITNTINFDAQSVKYISSIWNCRTNFLPLLQTKLGFFSEYEFNSEVLRNLLSVFPFAIKNKGSIRAIRQILNAYLKSYSIESSYIISYYETGEFVIDTPVSDQTLVVGVDTAFEHQEVLEQLLKYVLPAGVNLKVIVFSGTETMEKYIVKDAVKILIISTNYNSKIRNSDTTVPSTESFTEFKDRNITAVNTTEVISSVDTTENELKEYPEDINE